MTFLAKIFNGFVLGCLFSVAAGAQAPQSGIDLVEMERLLGSAGAVGEVHAARAQDSMYVFTYRNPRNFFDFLHFSMIPKSSEVEASLANLKRHDKVRLKGALVENRSQQKHIEVEAVEMVEAYNNPHHPGAYEYSAEIPAELREKSSANFLVHAVHKDGEILVLEYKDVVMPVFVKKEQAHLTKDLFRNDVINLHYQIQRYPERPTHLRLNAEMEKPLEVLQSVLPMHNTDADVTGYLVLFPKSPQVIFDVFAVLEERADGLQRQYTLINFSSMEVFEALRNKCSKAWNDKPQDFVNGRNKLIHKTVKVRAKGKFNVVDPNQANVQILVENLDDLTIVE